MREYICSIQGERTFKQTASMCPPKKKEKKKKKALYGRQQLQCLMTEYM